MSTNLIEPPVSQPRYSASPQLKTQESALQGLLDYCTEQSVFITPAIAAQNFPGRGLGIYTVKAVKKGQTLVRVPPKSLLTTQSIPKTFLPKQIVEKKFSVHCALAAYLAFGGEDVSKKYGRWMDTWPKIEEFMESMPVFWWEDFRVGDSVKLENDKEPGSEERATKRRKTIDKRDVTLGVDVLAKNVASMIKPATTPSFGLPPAIDGKWLTISVSSSTERSSSGSVPPSTTTALLPGQARKLRSCIATISKHLPNIDIYSPASQSHYLRFLYAWSIVNTRSFYYLRPGQSPPEDSNEAMALCPFQDLFNHSPAKGCVAVFDKCGFYVTADKDYPEGVELFINYGRHSNDFLWAEYGFFVDENEDDVLGIEDVVLSSNNESFSDKDKQALNAAGYLGGYMLKKDGVCYRTIIASYFGILDSRRWTRMVNGGLDAETSTVYAPVKLSAKQRITGWISKVQREAERNLEVLLTKIRVADPDLLVATFIGDASLTDEQRGSMKKKMDLARKRHSACVRRWMQIFDMCKSAIRTIEGECPGAYLDVIDDSNTVGAEAAAEAARKKSELEVTAEEFVNRLKSGAEEAKQMDGDQ